MCCSLFLHNQRSFAMQHQAAAISLLSEGKTTISAKLHIQQLSVIRLHSMLFEGCSAARDQHSCTNIHWHSQAPLTHSLEACSSPRQEVPPVMLALQTPETHVPTLRRQSGGPPQRTALAAPCTAKGCTTSPNTAETHSPTRWKALLYTSLRFATSFSILFRRGLRMRACTARTPADFLDRSRRLLHSTCCCMAVAAIAASDQQTGLTLSGLNVISSGSALHSSAAWLPWRDCLT